MTPSLTLFDVASDVILTSPASDVNPDPPRARDALIRSRQLTERPGSGSASGNPRTLGGECPEGEPMQLLVIGGTAFVGRAAVAEAVARGHQVTLFHRGEHEPEGMAAARHVHGDRDGDLGELGDTIFDAVFDTCGYVPRIVEASARRLVDRVGTYAFVSTLSVHADDMPAGANEDTPTHAPPWPQTEEVTGETYGPLKAACEEVVRATYGDRALVLRPGYIVGPHDPTERFVSWLRRLTAGGTVAVPGPPEEPFQVVDVRDLAGFTVDLLELETRGTFGVVGPGQPLTTRRMCGTAIDVSGADTQLAWLDGADALEIGDEDGRYRLFPMWHPEYPGVNLYDASRAVAAGLRHRSFDETVADTLAWDRARPQEQLPFGPTPEEEAELLAKARGSAAPATER